MNNLKIEIQNTGAFHGVVAKEKISSNEIILKMEGILMMNPNRYSIQLGSHKHLYVPLHTNGFEKPGYFWRYLNHHCEPNVAVDTTGMCIKTLRDILPGEELRFNYLTTEYDMDFPFDCTCGSSKCYGRIKGYKYLRDDQKKILVPFIAPHLHGL